MPHGGENPQQNQKIYEIRLAGFIEYCMLYQEIN
eukprot:COSAG02_NODE_42319_length_385_cov_1.272727_1_plen_33_part_01